MPQTASWTDLCREPFRLLFPLAVLFGGAGVGYWVLQAFGVSAGPTSIHAFSQIAAYMYCFIAGFLMTALPRFSSSATASPAELATVLILLTLHQGLAWAGHWVLAHACFLGLLLAIAVFAGRRFAGRKSPAGPPVEFLWILIGVAAGLAGGGLLIAGHAGLISPWWFGVAKPLAQQGFVLAVVAGVAGFMAPRLMGRELTLMPGIRRRKLAIHALAALAFLGSFLLEGYGQLAVAYLMRAAVVTSLLWWTSRLHRPPAKAAVAAARRSRWCIGCADGEVGRRSRSVVFSTMVCGSLRLLVDRGGKLALADPAPGHPDP